MRRFKACQLLGRSGGRSGLKAPPARPLVIPSVLDRAGWRRIAHGCAQREARAAREAFLVPASAPAATGDPVERCDWCPVGSGELNELPLVAGDVVPECPQERPPALGEEAGGVVDAKADDRGETVGLQQHEPFKSGT